MLSRIRVAQGRKLKKIALRPATEVNECNRLISTVNQLTSRLPVFAQNINSGSGKLTG
jgi:hypothetical protein